ncbi:MAG: type III-A CRISPR-associated protein Cas10/Csm1, partial [Candidatus Gastranaerophilales bacterium]|nr:type III-A CRISPR-associated protein Cas10/Csm1 [Candidatus Gastranaerophilales bacterium]
MNKDNIVYASLLHDIGKLIGRADLIKKNHSVIGAEYIENSHNEKLSLSEIINAIKFHHADNLKNANIQDNDISYIVYEADNIASGIDRRENVEQDAEDYVNKWSKFDKNLCLSSVFNKIKEDTNYSYLLQDLDEVKEPNYPFNASYDKYGSLKKELDKNIEYIDSPNSLLQLFESIMSYIPSSTDKSQVSDISLYDHVKITAAIASCMNDYFCENNIDNYKNQCFNKAAIENKRKQNYYRLISLDLSGIQDFIYTISSKSALKSLRARSFYLEILLEHIIDEILEYLELSRANLLYSGGGHAYLLLPNTKNTNDCIDKTDKNINNWLLKQFSTSLYLAAASIECSSFDLMNNCSLKFEELSKIMSKKKLQRYNEKQLSSILEQQKTNLKEINRECVICKSSSNKINEENICAFCANLINLGKILVSKRSFGIFILKDSETNLLTLPSINGEDNYLQVKEIADNLQAPDTKNLINASKRIYSVNRWYKGNEKFSCNLWLGNYTCGVSEFEELSKLSTGINRLGVMRADVDNLGQIFSKGFNHENYSTLSRYATLSRLLSMFFKHYIN